LRKVKKILFISALCLILVFIIQKTVNFYIERQINIHLAPYNISADLKRLNTLTLNHKNISLTCKLKIDGKNLTLTPLTDSLIAKLLPDKIKIPLG